MVNYTQENNFNDLKNCVADLYSLMFEESCSYNDKRFKALMDEFLKQGLMFTNYWK